MTTPRSAAVPDDVRAQTRHGYRVLAVTTLGLLFVIINGSSVNVALPDMSDYFGVSAQTADWFLLAFMLANTASILVFGRISDMVGRKRIYLVGLGFYVALCAVSAFAPDASSMILLRALQGVAAATTVANTSALIADAFPAHLLAYGLSLNLTAAAVGNSLGPTVGGFLITWFGWQSIFLVNVPFGIAAIVLGARVLPRESHRPDKRESFDVAGALLSALGLAVLLYGVNQISDDGVTPLVLGCLGLGVAMIVAFVVVEMRVRFPLVDVALVRDYARACAYGAAFWNSFARAGLTVLVVLQQQIVGHRSAAEAGFVIMMMALTMMIGAPLAGRLTNYFTARAMSGAGGAVLVVGCLGLITTVGSDSLVATCGWLILSGLGIGFFTTPNSTAIMAGIAPNRRATANAVRSMLFNSAQTIGTTIALLLVAGSGVDSYADQIATAGVKEGFRVGYLVFLGAAVIALILGIARGGPWRVRPVQVPREIVGEPRPSEPGARPAVEPTNR
jgi:EmrB/QacA subfamily drug resistance transporter